MNTTAELIVVMPTATMISKSLQPLKYRALLVMKFAAE
jgi:hypothetical protein